MPKLPDFTDLGENPTPQPDTNVATYQPGAVGQALQTSGTEIERAGFMIARGNWYRDKMTSESAMNDLQNARVGLEFGTPDDPKSGFRNVQGQPAMGQDFNNDYMEKFEAAKQQIAQRLPNDQARQMFAERAGIEEYQYKSALLGHQATQTHNFYEDTVKSTLANELRNIVQSPDDNPKNNMNFDGSIKRINSAIDDWGAYNNNPQEAEAQKDKALDAAWSSRIMGVMDHDPYGAQRMLDMHPGLKPVLQREIDQRLNIKDGSVMSDAFIQGRPLVGIDQWSNAIRDQGEHGKPGQISSAGAMGPYQMLEPTAQAMAHQLGIPYDKDRLLNDDAYGKQLSQQFIRNNIKEFGGVPEMVAAAYIAGPQKVEDLAKQIGDPRTGQISGAQWASKIQGMPQTSAYIQRVVSGLGDLQSTPMNLKNSGDVISSADKYLRENFPNDNEMRVHALSSTNGFVTEEKRQNQAQIMDARNNIYDTISKLNDAKTPPRDMESLIAANPNVSSWIQTWRALDPKGAETGMNALFKQEANVRTQKGDDAYYQLLGEYHKDPAKFLNEDIDSLKGDLTASDIHELKKYQSSYDGTKIQAQAVSERWMPVINKQLKLAQVSLGEDDLNKLYGRFFDESKQFTSSTGKPMNDEQGRKLVNSLLMEGHEKGNYSWFGLGGPANVQRYQAEPSKFYFDVPKDQVQKFSDSFKRVYGRDPIRNDAKNHPGVDELADYYTRWAIQNGGQSGG